MEDDKSHSFNVRDINVLKITNAADALIALEEANFTHARISEQLKELPFGNDKEWIKDAKRALNEVTHKLQMIAIKKKYLDEKAKLEAERLAATRDPTTDYRLRFVKAAERILPTELFEKIRQTAMDMRR
jgi:hypothetical protein